MVSNNYLDSVLAIIATEVYGLRLLIIIFSKLWKLQTSIPNTNS